MDKINILHEIVKLRNADAQFAVMDNSTTLSIESFKSIANDDSLVTVYSLLEYIIEKKNLIDLYTRYSEDNSKIDNFYIKDLTVDKFINLFILEILNIILDGPHESLKIFIARSEFTPISILFKMSKSDNNFVREAVFKNPNFNMEKYLNDFVNESS